MQIQCIKWKQNNDQETIQSNAQPTNWEKNTKTKGRINIKENTSGKPKGQFFPS